MKRNFRRHDLRSLICPFLAHVTLRQPAQFVMDQRHKTVERLLVARTPG